MERTNHARNIFMFERLGRNGFLGVSSETGWLLTTVSTHRTGHGRPDPSVQPELFIKPARCQRRLDWGGIFPGVKACSFVNERLCKLEEVSGHCIRRGNLGWPLLVKAVHPNGTQPGRAGRLDIQHRVIAHIDNVAR